MGYLIKNDYDEKIINACKNYKTMAGACASIGLHFNTFKRHALRLGVYNPNQGGFGTSRPKNEGNGKFYLQDILGGKHPQYQTLKLKERLITENIKERKCEICNIKYWNGKQLTMELDHIDGDRTNHLLENLRIICPNCHSVSPHYRGANMNSRK